MSPAFANIFELDVLSIQANNPDALAIALARIVHYGHTCPSPVSLPVQPLFGQKPVGG